MRCLLLTDLQKLWRGVPIDGVDERKIEEYLLRHNIVTMQDRVIKKVINIVTMQDRVIKTVINIVTIYNSVIYFH